jgi:hypothetical protein
MKRLPASSQLWLFEDGEIPRAAPQFTPLCLAFVLECMDALDRLAWPHSGRAGMIRETMRGAVIPFSNRAGVTRAITRVLRGDFPMPPDFRAEVERLRPQVREKLPFT